MNNSKLDSLVQNVNRRHGEGALMWGDAEPLPCEAISTGSLALDIALGVGGVPRGRVTEVFGPQASGKTTLCQHIIAEAQRQGLTAAFIDMEHALDLGWAQRCGVDPARLLIAQPGTGEQALDIVEAAVRSKEVSVVCVDSVAALVPRSEIEGDVGDNCRGRQSALMSQALRKLAALGPLSPGA